MKKYFPTTRTEKLSHLYKIILIGSISTVLLVTDVHADAIDELGSRPITVSERQFVEDVINKVEEAFPMPDEAWKRETQVSLGDDPYHRNTRQGDIYEGYNAVSMPVNIRIDTAVRLRN